MNMNLKSLDVWFVTGSQHLYGDETLRQVAEHSQTIAAALSASADIPVNVVCKPVLTTPDAISRLCIDANSDPACIGLITWMHTFSPAKMWIAGLNTLQKPFVHLHTQYNRDIPWDKIDMDFMNLNQSAHGGREFGFIGTRLRINRKVVVGFWQEKAVQEKLAIWMRAAVAWHDWQSGKVARFGDNMRQVAVTEGDKVEAQIRFGYSVNGYGVGDLVAAVKKVSDAQVDKLIHDYRQLYKMPARLESDTALMRSLKEAAKIEVGLRSFLQEGGYTAFTTTFEDLHGLTQLPGLAVQRLMADGYGFGAEGDWKTAALVRAIKVMALGLAGGTSFMEDYTYHLDPAGPMVLGAHMLEVCSSIADGQASLEVHPLGIGGKADPARLVFNVRGGSGLNASIIDLGNRFRLLVNEVDVVNPKEALPKLPVARVVWMPKPNLETAAGAWILAGGAHHTAFTMALTSEYLQDFADIADVEMVVIGENTRISEFKKELRWNSVYYSMNRGF